jgi:hypothetical protein
MGEATTRRHNFADQKDARNARWQRDSYAAHASSSLTDRFITSRAASAAIIPERIT